MDATQTYAAVNKKYSSIALSSSTTTTTFDAYATRVASSFGYSASTLSSLPSSANLGLSCGNPLALTHIHSNETVIDLGSGGGLDCLNAANAMAKASRQSESATPLTGKVYGIDSAFAMVELARRNVEVAKLPARRLEPSHGPDKSDDKTSTATTAKQLVEIIHSPITNIPLPTASANLIISNCVINLVPHADKRLVFTEIYRLLHPGGRVAISDILSKKPLPDEMRRSVALVVDCVAGAASVHEYKTWMMEAGFVDKIVVRETGRDLNVYKQALSERDGQDVKGCCGANVPGPDSELLDEKMNDIDFNEWVGAFEIYAVK